MVNHIRTLLLNEDGLKSPGSSFPLEEYVEKDFSSINMPFECEKVAKVLFGNNSDRGYKNWRLYQLSRMAESTDLFPYWFKFDSRATHFDKPDYDDSTEYNKIRVASVSYGTKVTFNYTIEGLSVPKADLASFNDLDLLLLGNLRPDDINGRAISSWSVKLTSGNILELYDTANPNVGSVTTLSYSSALSQRVPLPGTGLDVAIRPNTSNEWIIDIVAKPTADLGTVLANLDAMSDIDTNFVLSGSYSEFEVFSNYWKNSSELPERLTAITLGLAYKLEEKRNQK